MSGNCRKMAEIGMDFSLIKLVFGGCGVVWYFNVDGHLVDAFILLYSKRLVGWLVASKVRWLIHIKPNS